MGKVTIKKETLQRLHDYCCRGERHENLVNRLIDECEKRKKEINLSEEIVQRLHNYTGSDNIDEALNILMDDSRFLKKN